MCTNIERVAPETISLHSSDTQLEILVNVPLKNDTDEYNCQFRLTDENEFLY
ncbi:unnamed protein product, partial [Rotaria magnacalcarata]